MATNVATLDKQPAIVEASNAVVRSVALNTLRRYLFRHDSVEDDGTTASTAVIVVAYGDASSITVNDDGDNRARLASGKDLWVGPGVSKVSFQAVSGLPTMSIVPDGELFENS